MPPTGNPYRDTTLRFVEAHNKERDEILRLMLKLAAMRAAAMTRIEMTRR